MHRLLDKTTMPKINRNTIPLQKVYAYYKNKSKEKVSKKVFKQILDLYGEEFVKFLLEGKDVKIHSGLSVMGVRKDVKFTYTDFKASKEQGKRVLKPNTHSGNYGAKVYWGRGRTKINSRGWRFTPNRSLSRGISKVMKQYLGHTTFVKRIKVYKDGADAAYRKKVLNIDV
jgi:hypothetical protein